LLRGVSDVVLARGGGALHAALLLAGVDGSHSYDHARADSETALRLVKSRGWVLWHDYGVWPGVTRALEELGAARKLGLRHIGGTSLVIWRAPQMYVPDAPAGQDCKDEIHLAPTGAPVMPSDRPISAEKPG
jgi:hypothetical protein